MLRMFLFWRFCCCCWWWYVFIVYLDIESYRSKIVRPIFERVFEMRIGCAWFGRQLSKRYSVYIYNECFDHLPLKLKFDKARWFSNSKKKQELTLDKVSLFSLISVSIFYWSLNRPSRIECEQIDKRTFSQVVNVNDDNRQLQKHEEEEKKHTPKWWSCPCFCVSLTKSTFKHMDLTHTHTHTQFGYTVCTGDIRMKHTDYFYRIVFCQCCSKFTHSPKRLFGWINVTSNWPFEKWRENVYFHQYNKIIIIFVV